MSRDVPKYSSITIQNVGTGKQVRLSVGSDYQGYEVREIRKVEPPEDFLKFLQESGVEEQRQMAATPVLLRPTIGTYEIVFRDESGKVFDICDNQHAATAFLVIGGQLEMVPAKLNWLCWNSNSAEFGRPIK